MSSAPVPPRECSNGRRRSVTILLRISICRQGRLSALRLRPYSVTPALRPEPTHTSPGTPIVVDSVAAYKSRRLRPQQPTTQRAVVLDVSTRTVPPQPETHPLPCPCTPTAWSERAWRGPRGSDGRDASVLPRRPGSGVPATGVRSNGVERHRRRPQGRGPADYRTEDSGHRHPGPESRAPEAGVVEAGTGREDLELRNPKGKSPEPGTLVRRPSRRQR